MQVAGDTWAWTKALADYPASAGWSLSYAFRLQQGSGLLDITASASGDNFAITVAASNTSALKSGIWLWASYVTLAGARYSVGTGTLTVKPNLALITFDTDLRSDAKQAYDNALVAWKKVSMGQTVMLNDRTYTQFTITELIKYVDRCKADYARELQGEAVAAGLSAGNKIKTSFRAMESHTGSDRGPRQT